jgi:2-oxoglutarate ferredoxin oxidoreductase subunit alpha
MYALMDALPFIRKKSNSLRIISVSEVKDNSFLINQKLMSEEIFLMKGNEAIAHAAIRYGADGYFGYPITPQSEILETLMNEAPWKTTGMVVLQAESETASVNMVYGGAGCGKAVMTSSSSPGMSLMLEGVSYIAAGELPCLLVNVMRGGPGLGTIQPSQADYFQAVKGGGHGDYKLITLAPGSVQEMSDFVVLGFDLAFKYQTPVMILTDGVIGQMMEKVKLPAYKRRRTDAEIREQCPWATLGKPDSRKPNIITTLELDSQKMEINNLRLQAKYKKIENELCMYQEINCEDADYILVAFGSAARLCQKAMELARAKGIKVGLIRPITLWPFPSKEIDKYSSKIKGILTVEMNAGQMVEDVRLSVNGKVRVEHYGRMGGIVPTPSEVVDALENKFGL